MNKFASRLRQYRTSHQLNQKQMADMCTIVGRTYGVVVTPKNISDYECGHHYPNNKKGAVICKVIGMRVSTLSHYRGVQVYATPRVKKAYNSPRSYKLGGGSITININQ